MEWDVGMKRTIAVFVGLLALVGPAVAESPVAIVEEIQGKVTGAEFMDYLAPKTVIKLSANSSVVISYLKSCRREKIDGLGTVIVSAGGNDRANGGNTNNDRFSNSRYAIQVGAIQFDTGELGFINQVLLRPKHGESPTGWEYNFAIITMCLAVLAIGSGKVALDHLLFGRPEPPESPASPPAAT